MLCGLAVVAASVTFSFACVVSSLALCTATAAAVSNSRLLPLAYFLSDSSLGLFAGRFIQIIKFVFNKVAKLEALPRE